MPTAISTRSKISDAADRTLSQDANRQGEGGYIYMWTYLPNLVRIGFVVGEKKSTNYVAIVEQEVKQYQRPVHFSNILGLKSGKKVMVQLESDEIEQPYAIWFQTNVELAHETLVSQLRSDKILASSNENYDAGSFRHGPKGHKSWYTGTIKECRAHAIAVKNVAKEKRFVQGSEDALNPNTIEPEEIFANAKAAVLLVDIAKLESLGQLKEFAQKNCIPLPTHSASAKELKHDLIDKIKTTVHETSSQNNPSPVIRSQLPPDYSLIDPPADSIPTAPTPVAVVPVPSIAVTSSPVININNVVNTPATPEQSIHGVTVALGRIEIRAESKSKIEERRAKLILDVARLSLIGPIRDFVREHKLAIDTSANASYQGVKEGLKDEIIRAIRRGQCD